MSSVARQKFMLKLRTWVLSWVGVLALIGFIFFLIAQWDYYSMGRADRPFHEAHQLLRPSGGTGLPMGVIATALIILNLAYLIRKRLIRWTFLGPLRLWMDLHVLTGLIGGGLIIFHSALAPSSALGTTAAVALLLTVLTGLIGRTIYIQVPRSLEGRELELDQVRDELNDCRLELEAAGVDAGWLELPEPEMRAHQASLLASFAALLKGYRERTNKYRKLKRQIFQSLELRKRSRRLLPLVKNYCIHAQWLTRYHELRALLASWRFFHRWLAMVMLCIVACHVVVAVRFAGLDWSFGR